MKLVSLAVFGILLIPTAYLSANADTPPKKLPTRNFMVTECVKGKCLMKMRPHEKRIDKDGKVYWVKIQ